MFVEPDFKYFFNKYVLSCCLDGAYFSMYFKEKSRISDTVNSKFFFYFLRESL